jgi:hypothetical protein
MKKVILLGLALAGCASALPQGQWSQEVVQVQTSWAVAKVVIGLAEAGLSPAQALQVERVKAALDQEIQGLSQTSSPADFGAALRNLEVLTQALPDQSVSPEHKAEIEALVATLELLATERKG